MRLLTQRNPATIDRCLCRWAEAELARQPRSALSGRLLPRLSRDSFSGEGLRERFPIYNLYHLLNHLNLFGEGYLGEVISILSRYGA
jgi:hypothetical protein